MKLGKKFRIRAKSDFAMLFDRPSRAADSVLTLLVKANTLGYSRYGIAISSRHGNAVKRNRVKRISRAAIRQVMASLPAGLDFMLVPRTGKSMSVEKIANSLTRLSAKVAARDDLT